MPPNHLIAFTLPETNIAPENRPSQKETSIPTIHFQGRKAVSFRVPGNFIMTLPETKKSQKPLKFDALKEVFQPAVAGPFLGPSPGYHLTYTGFWPKQMLGFG